MSKLIINLLGKFSLGVGSPEQPCKLPPLPQILLVYFLFHRHRWHTREEIIEQFWPEHPPRKAGSSLTSTLSRLHQAIPSDDGPLIRNCGSNALMFSDDVDMWIDTDAFEAEASLDDTALSEREAERLETAMQLYHGDLLPGWHEDWILIERERLRHLFVVSLGRLMAFHEQTGALERAVACGQRLLKFEPLHEATHEALMRIYLRTGFRAAALKQYELCRTLLEAKFAVLPNDKLRALYAKARNPDSRPRNRSARSAAARELEHSGSSE